MEKYIDMKKENKLEKLQEVAEIIKNGGIVVFPTETVYGIGTNGLNKEAIKRLYEIKQRPQEKPISLLVNSIEMIEQIAKDITEIEYKIIKEFFPGSITIILKKKDIVPDILTANGDTVGVRMPKNEIALKLIEYSNCPIATPSANISGKPSGTNMKNIMKDFEGKADYFVDGGESKLGLGSTIVKVVDGKIKILRQGTITEEEILKRINNR